MTKIEVRPETNAERRRSRNQHQELQQEAGRGGCCHHVNGSFTAGEKDGGDNCTAGKRRRERSQRKFVASIQNRGKNASACQEHDCWKNNKDQLDGEAHCLETEAGKKPSQPKSSRGEQKAHDKN